MKIETKQVKRLNKHSGYIPMKKEEVGQEFIVLSKDLEHLIGADKNGCGEKETID